MAYFFFAISLSGDTSQLPGTMPKNYDLFLKGGVGGWYFSSEFVNWSLDKKKNEEVHVLINSLGGYTHEGVAISSLFKLHGNVHVHFVGHNASAATIAAMGAKKITIDEDAAFLVHKCLYPIMEWAYKNADELDDYIKKLEQVKKDNDTLDSCVAGMYARRCKKSKEDLLALMKVGGWLTPEQALEWGFVDEITHYTDDEKPELSEASISALSDAGIPLPPNFAKKKGSIMERFFAFLQSSFSNPAPDDNPGANNTSLQMSKLSALCALLGASLAIADDKLTLSAEQAQQVDSLLDENKKSIDSLNASVAEKDQEIAELKKSVDTLKASAEDLKASIAEKDQEIAELKKTPGDGTSDVVDPGKSDDPYSPVSEADALAASKAFASL